MQPISRRTLVAGLITCSASFAQAQNLLYEPLAELPPLPPQYLSLADERPMNQEFANEVSVQGTLQPSLQENEIASEIIKAVDSSGKVRPIEVAGFLLDVARGKYGDDWRPYTRAWPVDAHANPLILDFFRATKTHPVGDTTAWCAAFINWCILKGHKGSVPEGGSPGTSSAASSSFREWGTGVLTYDNASSSLLGSSQPRAGDLAVFAEVRQDGSLDPIHGHVGFFLDMDSARVRVLGGNQFEGHPIVHAINVKWIPKNGFLRLHSIRTDKSLSNA
jgi:CHAP domain